MSYYLDIFMLAKSQVMVSNEKLNQVIQLNLSKN
jgi:hypothetical protein